MTLPWPDADVDTLLRLNAEHFTPSQIGIRMGRSRCSVLGKLMRLGVRMDHPGKGGTPRGAKSYRRNGAGLVGPVRAPTPVVMLKTKRPRGAKAIMALSFNECRYIVAGEGSGAWFCAAVTEEGQPYCAAHRRICYDFSRHRADLTRLHRLWA